MKIESKGNIKYNGDYHMPGTPFECEDKEAVRLIAMGVATKDIDPKMLQVAAEKLIQAEKAKKELQKKLEEAENKNAENKKKIEDLNSKLEKAEDKKDQDKIKKQIKSLNSKMLDSDKLSKQLDNKGEEIKKYSV